MKISFALIASIACAALLAACASGNPALRTAQMQSELSNGEATKANLPSEKIQVASSALDSSKAAEQVKDDQLALVLAELSNLRYRVIFAEATRDSAKAQTKDQAGRLADDEKRLKAYKEILKNESKGGK